MKTFPVVCFLLGNSPASELPRREHTTFRTRRKFENKKNFPVYVMNKNVCVCVCVCVSICVCVCGFCNVRVFW